MLCLPVLGLSVFNAIAPVQKSNKLLFIKGKGINAEGLVTHDGFVVRSGSGAVKMEVPSCQAFLKQLRAALIDNGVLKLTDNSYSFTQDYVFTSPSTAAGVVQGRATNSRVDWKNKDGVMLKELQEAELTK